MKNIHIIIGICILVVFVFFLGFMWNTGRFKLFGIPKDTFTCLSHNNSSEAYQMNCFLPVAKNEFKLSNNVECTAYTNQTFDYGIWRQNDPERNNMTFTKSDYIHFNLEFLDNNIVRTSSNDNTNTKYQIIKNTDDVIQGISLEENIGSESDFVPTESFITISKKYGKGMEVWHNGEWYGDASIGSFFFQCK